MLDAFSRRMKGWQRLAIVLSVIEFIGVGALLWFQYVSGNNDFYGAQLRVCVTQLDTSNQSLPSMPAGVQRDRKQTDNFEKYLSCQAQARKSFDALTESQKETIWMIAMIDAAIVAAGWLLAVGVISIVRWIRRSFSKSPS